MGTVRVQQQRGGEFAEKRTAAAVTNDNNDKGSERGTTETVSWNRFLQRVLTYSLCSPALVMNSEQVKVKAKGASVFPMFI